MGILKETPSLFLTCEPGETLLQGMISRDKGLFPVEDRRVRTLLERERVLQELRDWIMLDAVSFSENTEDSDRRLRLFLWVLASEQLKLRFVFPRHVEQPGLYHEKMGVFEFLDGRTIQSARLHNFHYIRKRLV